jgi:citrate lyase beta subunit
MAGAPDGIVLPKTEGPDQVRLVSAELDALEQRHGLAPGSTRLLPLVSETAGAALTIPAYVGQSLPRLAGLTWGAEDLSAVLGATRKRDAAGRWTDTFRFVRAQTLLPRMRWRSGRSIRCMPISATKPACAPPPKPRAQTALRECWRFIRRRCR